MVIQVKDLSLFACLSFTTTTHNDKLAPNERRLARKPLVRNTDLKSKQRRRPGASSPQRPTKEFVVPLAGVLSSVAARLFDMGQASSKRGARGDEEQQPDVEPEGSPLAHESSPEQPASTPPDQPAPASPTIDAKVSRKPTLISFFNLSRKSTSRSPMSSTPGRRISHRPRGDDLPPDLQTGSEQLSSDYDQDSLASPRPDDDDNSSRSDDGLMNRDYLLARSSIVSRQQERQASPRSRATICAVIVCFLMLAAISAVALVLGSKYLVTIRSMI